MKLPDENDGNEDPNKPFLPPHEFHAMPFPQPFDFLIQEHRELQSYPLNKKP